MPFQGGMGSSARLALLIILATAAPIAQAAISPARAGAQCIDEAIRDELNARRRYRGVRERLFQKARKSVV